jgi:hypothetical protein
VIAKQKAVEETRSTRHRERRLSSNQLRVEEVKRATLVKDIRRLS